MAKNELGSKAKNAVKDAKKAVVKAKDTAITTANKAVETITEVKITPEELVNKAAQKVSKTLANKALTKTAVYPIVKRIAG